MKKFSEFLKNLSVSWKFVLAYYAVLIIPMAFFGLYFYMQASDDSISQAKLVMERNLLQTRASIMEKVKIIENVSQIIASDDNVQSIFYYDYGNENYRVKDFQFDISPMLSNMHFQNKLMYATRIYTPKTIFTMFPGSYYSIRIKDSPEWYAAVSSRKPTVKGWIPSHKSIGNDLRESEIPEQVFSYNNYILSKSSKEVTGILEIEVEEKKLLDMLRDPVISKWGKVFVTNNQGVILSNNIPSLYKSNITSLGFVDYTPNEQISHVESYKSKKSIMIAIPVEDLNCSIVGLFPIENFNADAKGSLLNLLIVLAVLSVILGLIIYFITNILLRRIKKLVRAMKQVRDNNLDVSVPVNSKDEFGELTLNFNHMTSRIHELVETVYKIELMERNAELKALEAQINPHFLYNTLATISWVSRKGKSEEVSRITNSLAKFYRLVLSKGGTLISVRDEIEMVRSYLQIQKFRFEDMFDIIYDLDEDAMDCMIIKNLLQPLTENALVHGIEPKRAHGSMMIRTRVISDHLIIEIIDDGVGMKASTLSDVIAGRVERSSGGYAVKNVIERLKTYYGANHSFHIFSKPGIGAQIIITINLAVAVNPIPLTSPDTLNIPGGTSNV